MAKKTTKHYPEAYYRYREKHPTVSILLSKETKTALDEARGKGTKGEMTYPKFLTSLFTPNGVFSQFKKQKDQLASERVALENEKKRQRAQLDSERIALENEKKKQKDQLASERVALENEIKEQKDQLASERVALENEIKEQVARLALMRGSVENEKKNLDKIERFYVPCSKCGNPILFDNTEPEWNSEIKPMLREKFRSAIHIDCPK
jgi:DNA repair exonuclease SbcCD ATPase subunit